ncbi:MAG: TIGR02678 family protein, partial [Acidimicrobiia bacterium]|nr:TIGR02678 family protein [Acidimicrobiia bacterium]
VRPTDGVTATTDRAQVELLSGRVVGDDEVDRAVEAVIRRHAAGLRRDVADDAAEARAVALETLLAFDLLRQAPGGWQVRPALARYRLGTAAADGSGGGDRAEGSGGLQGSLDFGDGR